MASETATPEETVTAEDLQDKWNEIKRTVRRTTQRRVLGMTYLTAGGLLLGAGALGLAFWLGRSSSRPRPRAPEDVVETEPPRMRQPRHPDRVSRVLGPALETAVNTAVTTAVKTAVNAMTGRLREETE